MINTLVIGLFVSVLSIEYLIRERGLLHPYLILLPELLSGVAMAIVLARLMAGARVSLDWRYLAFFAALTVTMLFGFIVQDVSAGAMVAGIRVHVKFLPFFLLPAVIRFTPGQLRAQFAVLLTLFVAQAPLALYQRFVEFADTMQTGDPVRGTATTSSALSMVMMCGTAAVVCLYLRKKIRLPVAMCVIAVLLLPTTLNETKATLLMLPMALIVPALVMPKGSRAAQRMLPIVVVGGVAMAAFVAVYDYLIQYSSTGQPIGQFVGETSFLRYLYSGAAEQGANYIGRFDSLEFALQGIGGDPLTAAFGLGAGNVSPSFLPQFDGEYADYYDRYGVGMTQITSLLWQVGFVGLASYLLLYHFVLSDARALARGHGELALLGQIWVVVTVIMVFA
ncbi:MAG TPA: hypothetical protein VFB99_18975, partial [Vicinamibacterales bacterium]|nr:hypothetical protein [Vicinamibacterales bacterium]